MVRNKGGVLNYPKKPIELTDSDVELTIGKFPLVVVDCYTHWCELCKRLSQTIDKIVRDNSGKVMFGRINVHINRVTATRFDITKIPTLLIFKKGKLVGNIIGNVPRKDIEDRIRTHI